MLYGAFSVAWQFERFSGTSINQNSKIKQTQLWHVDYAVIADAPRLPLGRISLAVIVNLTLNSHEIVKLKWLDKFININESIASLVFYIHLHLLCKRWKH